MATRTPTFTAIPNVPQVGLQPWQFFFYNAVKENLELLTGSRNGTSAGNRAITSEQVTVVAPPAQNMTKVTAEGAGVQIEKATVPTAEDYAKLISNVQTLANDVANLRNTVDILIRQLKGSL